MTVRPSYFHSRCHHHKAMSEECTRDSESEQLCTQPGPPIGDMVQDLQCLRISLARHDTLGVQL